MRLLTAIPLLFWVGTAAVAHFVHACATTPVDVAGDVTSGESSLHTFAPADSAIPADAGRALNPDAGLAARPLPVSPAATPLQFRAGGRVIREQVFASARLLANPPPPAV